MALGLGGHLLRACEKYIVDTDMKKRFLLKFLFVFDLAISRQDAETGIASDDQPRGATPQSQIPAMEPKQVEAVIQSLVETLTKLVCLDFMKECTGDELKVVFYSIWNLAFEAKTRGLVHESQVMLGALYEHVKRFAQYCHEQRLKKGSVMGEATSVEMPQIDDELVHTIVYRTLSLMADLNVHVKNFPAARTAIQDLERLHRNDADTYILKIRVLLNESLNECTSGGGPNSNNHATFDNTFSKRNISTMGGTSSFNMSVFSKRSDSSGSGALDRMQQEIMDCIAAMHKTDNFHFAHLLVVMYEADQIRI